MDAEVTKPQRQPRPLTTSAVPASEASPAEPLVSRKGRPKGTRSGKQYKPPDHEALLLNRNQVAKILGISFTSIHRLEASGQLKPRKLIAGSPQGRTFYRRADVMALVNETD